MYLFPKQYYTKINKFCANLAQDFYPRLEKSSIINLLKFRATVISHCHSWRGIVSNLRLKLCCFALVCSQPGQAGLGRRLARPQRPRPPRAPPRRLGGGRHPRGRDLLHRPQDTQHVLVRPADTQPSAEGARSWHDAPSGQLAGAVAVAVSPVPPDRPAPAVAAPGVREAEAAAAGDYAAGRSGRGL